MKELKSALKSTCYARLACRPFSMSEFLVCYVSKVQEVGGLHDTRSTNNSVLASHNASCDMRYTGLSVA